MKIICAHRNHRTADTPDSMQSEIPVFFLKPESAQLLRNQPFFIPDFTRQITCSIEFVVRIDRLGKNIPLPFAHRYYDHVSAGLSLMATDLHDTLSAQALPTDISTAFDASAVIPNFFPLSDFSDTSEFRFRLLRNGECVQEVSTATLRHSVDALIAHASRYFMLKTGDILFTGAAASTPISIGDHLEGYLSDLKTFDFHIR